MGVVAGAIALRRPWPGPPQTLNPLNHEKTMRSKASKQIIKWKYNGAVGPPVILECRRLSFWRRYGTGFMAFLLLLLIYALLMWMADRARHGIPAGERAGLMRQGIDD